MENEIYNAHSHAGLDGLHVEHGLNEHTELHTHYDHSQCIEQALYDNHLTHGYHHDTHELIEDESKPVFHLPQFHTYDIVRIRTDSEQYEEFGDCLLMVLQDSFAAMITSEQYRSDKTIVDNSHYLSAADKVMYVCKVLYGEKIPQRFITIFQNDIEYVRQIKRSIIEQIEYPFNCREVFYGIPIYNDK